MAFQSEILYTLYILIIVLTTIIRIGINFRYIFNIAIRITHECSPLIKVNNKSLRENWERHVDVICELLDDFDRKGTFSICISSHLEILENKNTKTGFENNIIYKQGFMVHPLWLNVNFSNRQWIFPTDRFLWSNYEPQQFLEI